MRRLVLESTVLVQNLHIELAGSDQIKAVFDPEYEQNVNLKGCDRIGQYYFQPGDFDSDDNFKCTCIK